MASVSDTIKYKLVKGVSNWLILPMRAVFKKGDSCPGAVVPIPPPDCSSLQYVILITTGVTCVALLLDIAKRYIFTSIRTKDKSTITDGSDGVDGKTVEINGNFTGFKAGYEGGRIEPKLSNSQTYSKTVSFTEVSSSGNLQGGAPQTIDVVDNRQQFSKPLQEQVIAEADEVSSPSSPRTDVSDDGTRQDRAELSLMVDDLMNALRTSINSNKGAEDMPEYLKENASKMDNLESLFINLGREIDETSTDMVSAVIEPKEDSKTVLTNIEKETMAYKKCWLGLRRLLFCVDIHIRNSSHYQVFHHECDRLQTAIDKYYEELKSQSESSQTEQTPQEMKESVNDIEKTQAMIKMWGDAIARLCDQSKTIFPVHLRSEEISEDTAARALVNYNAENVTVKEGDIMLLVDNSDSDKWKLLTTSGDEVVLPSVCCVIPPPDLNTMKAVARIETAFKDMSDYVQEGYNKRLEEFSKQLINLLSSKDLTSISKEQRKELLEQIAFLEVFLGKFHKDGNSEEMLNRFSDVRSKVDALEDDDGDAVMTELLELFSSWVKVANIYETSVYDKEKRKLLVKQGIILDAEDTEWEALAEIEAARRELGLAVKIHRETMAVAEATKYESATGETRQTFSISGVVDPRDNSELSMAEAIEKGIINQLDGTYNNLKTGESYPIPVAMNAGLIIVGATKTTKARELKKAIGVITVEFKRETRPYKITHAADPITMEQLPINEAIDKGLFDTDQQVYKNTESGEEMSVENAIDSGYLFVEYDEGAESESQPEVTKKTFTVSSAVDRKTGKKYEFDDAVERGIIDKDAGMFHDTLTGQKINIVEAIQKKFMKGKVVTDPEKIDASFLRNRSGSVDSQTSESSKTSELE